MELPDRYDMLFAQRGSLSLCATLALEIQDQMLRADEPDPRPYDHRYCAPHGHPRRADRRIMLKEDSVADSGTTAS